eukprot:gene8600-6036_t
MDAATTIELSKSNPELLRVFRNHVPEMGFLQLDPCVVEFLIKMLEGQTNPESYLPEAEIEEAFRLYFREFNVFSSEKALQNAIKAIVDEMERRHLTQKPKEESSRLASAVSIGRQFEESVKKAAMIKSVGKVTQANTNEDWSWETKRNQTKDIRKKRREDEKKAMLAEEYEEFLRKRGIANASAIMKLHHKGEGTTYSTDIRCEGIRIRLGKTLLLDNTDLTLITGHKYGLVGRNGAGKTTLLRALSEHELEGVSPFMQILHVEQEIVAGSETPLQVLLSTDVERELLLKEEQELLKRSDDDANLRLNDVYARLDAIDAHSAESRAATILHGLSFTREMMNSPTTSLSGGWRMRVALARALFVEPDVLLLDEPTNHLDLFAVMWLEQFLQDWKKTLVVVSHSRTFLNNVCKEMIHLEGLHLSYYTGNYDQFEITRVEQLRQQKKQHDTQEKQRAHIQSFIDKFRYSAARAKMAQSRIKALERMETVADVVSDPQFSFQFPEPEPISGSYIELVDCEFGYKAGSTLFKDVNMSIDDSARIVLVGANGAGKSTFLNMCRGKLEPRTGHVTRNKKIRIAHFAQHHLETLTPQLSSVEFLRSKFPHVEEQQIRAHLGKMGLSGDRALQPIYTLSGGQKSRLVLSWITFIKPHLLLLDEPTNHLDIDTVNALIEALLAYRGSLVVISHDEYFITSLCDDIYVCDRESVKKFDGDFQEYRKMITKQLKHIMADVPQDNSRATLEQKLEDLMAALRRNGSDNWDGKPPQTPLDELISGAEPVAVSLETAASAPPNGGQDTLEGLMQQYVSDVTNVRRCEGITLSEPEAGAAPVGDAAVRSDPTMQDLLAALDKGYCAAIAASNPLTPFPSYADTISPALATYCRTAVLVAEAAASADWIVCFALGPRRSVQRTETRGAAQGEEVSLVSSPGSRLQTPPAEEDDDLTLGVLLGLEGDGAGKGELASRSVALSLPSVSSSSLAGGSPRPRATQLRLDFGQPGAAELGAVCPRCRMLYSQNEEDAAIHERYCRGYRAQHRDAGAGLDAAATTRAAQRAAVTLETAARSKSHVQQMRYPDEDLTGAPLTFYFLRCYGAAGLAEGFPRVAAAVAEVCGDDDAFFAPRPGAGPEAETLLGFAVADRQRCLCCMLSGVSKTRDQEPYFTAVPADSPQRRLIRPQTLADVHHAWCLPPACLDWAATTQGRPAKGKTKGAQGDRAVGAAQRQRRLDSFFVPDNHRREATGPSPSPACPDSEARRAVAQLVRHWAQQIIYGAELCPLSQLSYHFDLFGGARWTPDWEACLSQLGPLGDGLPCYHASDLDSDSGQDSALLVLSESGSDSDTPALPHDRDGRATADLTMMEEPLGEVARAMSLLNPPSHTVWQPPSPTSHPHAGDNQIERCTFFSKSGACRHGDNCTKVHVRPTDSPTVLFPMMYPNPLAVEYLPDYDGPRSFNKKYLQKHLEHFYKETWRAFMEMGRIAELRVVSNLGEHLLGNVYIRFESSADAAAVVRELRNKKFNKIPLLPELSPVKDFGEACCQADLDGSCKRGSQCNYLHIMKVSRRLLDKLEHEQSKYWKRQERGGKRERSRSRSNSPATGETCNVCGRSGHSSRDCPTKVKGSLNPPLFYARYIIPHYYYYYYCFYASPRRTAAARPHLTSTPAYGAWTTPELSPSLLVTIFAQQEDGAAHRIYLLLLLNLSSLFLHVLNRGGAAVVAARSRDEVAIDWTSAPVFFPLGPQTVVTATPQSVLRCFTLNIQRRDGRQRPVELLLADPWRQA